MHQSVATIDSPEFLNLTPLDVNPLMSKCEIKVFYIGENRNMSYISEQTAREIGKTLRGAPIVGYYRDTKEDFTDHGDKVIIDDEGIKFECQTVPYGFVSPDAEVWFQTFEDYDSMGNSVQHKYLMTTGYLWTGQFPESSLPVNEGRPQSMELEATSVKGQWEKSLANGLDFFIINDAVVQKLCILGADVEPCFQGAAVTAPKVSEKFTLDDKFKRTLFSMMQDLQQVLSRGGQNMGENQNITVGTSTVDSTTITANWVGTDHSTVVTAVDPLVYTNNVSTAYSIGSADNVATTAEETTEPIDATSTDFKKDEKEEVSDYAKKDDKQKEETSEDESTDDTETEDSSDTKDDEGGSDKKEEDDEKKNRKYELLEQELNDLKDKYSALENQYNELVEFKTKIDNQQKDALIAEFYMLSGEDKAEVIKNKEKYSLAEIKSMLSVICFDKKVNFGSTVTSADNKSNDETSFLVTTNFANENENLPEWVREVKRTENNL